MSPWSSDFFFATVRTSFKWTHTLCVCYCCYCDWLILLSMKSSRSKHMSEFPFFFMCNTTLYPLMDTWIASSFSAIRNNTGLSMGVQVSLWDPTFKFLGIYSDVELLDYIVISFLIFGRFCCHTVFLSSCIIYGPTHDTKEFQFLHILTTHYFLFFLNNNHLHGCDLPFIVIFICIIPSD